MPFAANSVNGWATVTIASSGPLQPQEHSALRAQQTFFDSRQTFFDSLPPRTIKNRPSEDVDGIEPLSLKNPNSKGNVGQSSMYSYNKDRRSRPIQDRKEERQTHTPVQDELAATTKWVRRAPQAAAAPEQRNPAELIIR